MDSLSKGVAGARGTLVERANAIRESFKRLSESAARLKDELALLRRSAEAPVHSRRNCPVVVATNSNPRP